MPWISRRKRAAIAAVLLWELEAQEQRLREEALEKKQRRRIPRDEAPEKKPRRRIPREEAPEKKPRRRTPREEAPEKKPRRRIQREEAQGKKQREDRRRRRVWCKKWLTRQEDLSHNSLPWELRDNPQHDFRNDLGMSDSMFSSLLEAVSPHITKTDTHLRKAIPAEQRLVATLLYLATGKSLHDLKSTTDISPQSLGNIIPETCAAIIEALKGEYMKLPSTEEEWLDEAKQFEDRWNIPNCGGAIDGRHVRICPPASSRSHYYNYKGFFSIVLLAIVNASYEFVMVDVGKNGRVSDGGAIEQTTFHEDLMNNRLNLPPNSRTKRGLNFVFVADEAVALHDNIIKPFPQEDLNDSRRLYNHRLSPARRVAENAFGIMAKRFQVLRTAISLRIDKIDSIIYACCVLHNFLCRQSSASYCPPCMIDQEDTITGKVCEAEWRGDPNALLELQSVQSNSSLSANGNRDRYVQYFNDIGPVQ